MTLPNRAATAKLGVALGAHLRPGDLVALDGDFGAGKTALARAAIQARLGRPVEVISPSFTLVQTYDAGDVLIWHFDLYRLTAVEEVEELGWDEALSDGIALVEWPKRAEYRLPPGHLAVKLIPGAGPDARYAVLSGPSARWRPCIDAIKRIMDEPSR